IPQYIKKYYKEHYVKSSRMVSDDELGNVYLITVKLEDSKYAVHLYFDLQGKFLKKIDEAEGKITKDNNKTIEQTKTQEKPESKYGTSEERVNATELPTNITKYLKKKYPQYSITESFFKTDNDLGNCYLLILKKSGDKKVIQLYFDLDGNLLKDETENQ
ncbi:MAG: PepSY-like domain-containing protein, partial [Bacteroidota bacterium]